MTKSQAKLQAKLETTRTGRRHIAVHTYQHTPSLEKIPTWTVILAQKEKL